MDRVHTQGPTRGEETRRQRDRHNQQRHAAENPGVGGIHIRELIHAADAIGLTGHEAGQRKTRGRSRQDAGRFECWHVKDAKGIKAMSASLTQAPRQQAADLVPVGQGEVDYKSIFAAAGQAGMKHFCIEQDNAARWGDSVAAARVGFNGLVRLLS